ncbi:MAG TPA: hypothetical protein VMS18_26015 [Candidatus Binatia bacterium]|nr:hypothetical protein [Candidatus Binatia bacterium]
MIPNRDAAISADDIIVDVALHDEIKSRAYELYDRQGHDTNDHDVKSEIKNELQFELHRVAYAAAQLQKCSGGEVGDTKVVRAARVYLRALTSFIGQA